MERVLAKVAAVAACALLPVGLLPAAAAAAPPYEPVEHYSSDYGPEVVVDEECGITFTVEGSERGTFFARPVKGSGGQAYYGHSNYTFTETLTTATGQLTLVGRGAFRESDATKVAGPVTYTYTPLDEQGNELPPREVTSNDVWSFVGKDSGVYTFYGSDGKAVLRFSGQFSTREQFDLLGDSQPGGRPVPDTFEVLREKQSWPRDGDVCAVLQEHLG